MEVWTRSLPFRCVRYFQICETVPAFRWTNGKLYGLSVNGKAGDDREYMYIHLQKRVMKFTPELESEDSFMIIPNEFVRDHELTEEEITTFMTSDPEYERAIMTKYVCKEQMTLLERIKFFMSRSKNDKIFRLKGRLNQLLGRKLSSIWKSKGIPDSYSGLDI